MVDESNPAGRLYRIIKDASSIRDNYKIRQVWSEVLECDEQDDAEITRRVVEVFNLCQEVQKLIKLIPDINHELYLSAFPNVEKALFPLHLNSSWQSQKKKLDPGVIAKLQFSSEELNRHYAEENISEENLKAIKAQVEQLFEKIKDSKIDPILRLTILEELERIMSAIAMYRIKGAKGLKEALQSTIGAVVSNPKEMMELKKSNPKVMEMLFKLLDKIDTFTARALKIKKVLIDPIMAMIGEGNG